MTDRNQNDDGDFGPLEERLQSSRPSLTPLELDRVKRRVISRAGRPQMNMRHRLVTALLVVGLVGTGGGAVLAANNGNGNGNGNGQGNGNGSANSQYCPPSSPGAGKPKTPHDGGAKCGQPNGGNDQGQNGNGQGGNSQGNGNGGQGQGNGKGNAKH